jgi:GNAT superfamily N-acetyltransferase
MVRPAEADDEASIWRILRPIIREGATRPLPRNISRQAAIAQWRSPDCSVFVADEGRLIVGTYYIRPNQAGGGKHVASCDFAVEAQAASRGIAADLVEHAILEARSRDYLALQLNFVVATDTAALQLYDMFDFAIIGRLLRAFRHPALGFVDALILHRFL